MGIPRRVWNAAEEWLLPPAVSKRLARNIRRITPISADDKVILAANARMNRAYEDRRCFVIGNGPSLARTDIRALAGEVTVVMNHFNRHPASRIWQATVHCAAEPASFYRGHEGVEFLRDLVSGFHSTTHVFPIELKPVFDSTGLIPSERLLFVRQDGRLAEDFDHIDLCGAVPSAQDTSILAVTLAIAMGCNPIILLGLDYDWLMRGPMGHFYSVEPTLPASAPFSYPDLPFLKKLALTSPRWQAHDALRRIAARSGQVIFNATPDSYLDVYPTADFDDFVQRDSAS
jgi:hypothetical protein